MRFTNENRETIKTLLVNPLEANRELGKALAPKSKKYRHKLYEEVFDEVDAQRASIYPMRKEQCMIMAEEVLTLAKDIGLNMKRIRIEVWYHGITILVGKYNTTDEIRLDFLDRMHEGEGVKFTDFRMQWLNGCYCNLNFEVSPWTKTNRKHDNFIESCKEPKNFNVPKDEEDNHATANCLASRLMLHHHNNTGLFARMNQRLDAMNEKICEYQVKNYKWISGVIDKTGTWGALGQKKIILRKR